MPKGSDKAEELTRDIFEIEDCVYDANVEDWGEEYTGLSQSELLYSRAIETGPRNACAQCNYAILLKTAAALKSNVHEGEGSRIAEHIITKDLRLPRDMYTAELLEWGNAYLGQASIIFNYSLDIDSRNSWALSSLADMIQKSKPEEGSSAAEKLILRLTKEGDNAVGLTKEGDNAVGTNAVHDGSPSASVHEESRFFRGLVQAERLNQRVIEVDPQHAVALRRHGLLLATNVPAQGSIAAKNLIIDVFGVSNIAYSLHISAWGGHDTGYRETREPGGKIQTQAVVGLVGLAQSDFFFRRAIELLPNTELLITYAVLLENCVQGSVEAQTLLHETFGMPN